MIYELKKEEYRLVTNFFQDKENCRIHWVISGEHYGRVFVDNKTTPSAVFILWCSSFIYMDGNFNNDEFVADFNKILNEEIIPELIVKNIDRVFFNLPSAKRSEKIREKINLVYSWKEKNYEMQTLKYDWRSNLPAGCEIKQYDQEFLQSKAYHEYGMDSEGYNYLKYSRDIYDSDETFFRMSGGCYLLENNKPVSCSVLFYNPMTNRYGMGIHTLPDYRGKNYGTITAAAASDICFAKGCTMDWECFDYNEGSKKIAEKIGHNLVKEYDLYPLFFNNFQHYHQAYCYFRYYVKDNYKALEYLIEMYKHRNVNDDQFLFIDKWSKYSYCYYFYVLFEMLVFTGNNAEALVNLDKAIEIGKTNPEQLQNLKEHKEIESEDVIDFLEKKREELSNSL